MSKQYIQLKAEERSTLEELVNQGAISVRTLKRALGLLALDKGETLTAVAAHQQVTIQTVGHWRDAYVAQGLACLQETPRSGRPVMIDGLQRAQLTALACSEPPAGYSQWSLRLLADKIVELGECEIISHTYVGQLLKKTNANPI